MMHGAIPSEIGSMAKLQYVYIQQNKFTGSVPDSLMNCQHMAGIYMHSNMLTGDFFGVLSLYNFSTPSHLGVIDISSNKFTGSIPTCIGGFSHLKYMYLFNNALSGTIPSSLLLLESIQHIIAHNNLITGTIPAFGNQSVLQYLDFYTNLLSGTVDNVINIRLLLLKLCCMCF